ncbi:hypothetical protein RH728_004031 [Vibrio vulnificus]|uniref:hypothetical protein n=3 Tax=Vibrio vulnificus TaxID=672 RepID=UPI0009B6F514|nr:hypothetical protein [Vibrio vulnificus]EGR0104613.1 hypothetical protein [Vibrio vulnificus]EHH1182412.1 hypothetical protein [Vibrio vulnificus]EHH1191772.1 hypothetical protein [Vibrio vulnificus]EHK9050293.1 hypothetical protein [Vibrio vulnificus]EHU4850169.1 hypothetical protein [Vibrio vulnificus]
MKSNINLLILVVLMASSASAKSDTDSEVFETQAPFLIEAIISTPYSAVVIHTNVDVINASDTGSITQFVYEAEVIETLRGKQHKQIRYTLYVEQDEDVILDTTPIIITLCSDNDEYYWPGVDAQFSGASSFVQAAKNNASQVDKHQSHFAFCGVN